MAIAFTEIPEALLVPGFYQEIDNSLAGAAGDVKRALMIGTMAASGTAAAGKAVQVRSADRAKKLFGSGSPAAIMAEEFLKHNTTEELWVLPIAEPSSGLKWNRSFEITSSNAVPGSVEISINGKFSDVVVKDNATASDIAGSIVAAINGMENCPVEAEVLSGESGKSSVKFSSVVKGVTGNYNTVSINSLSKGVSIQAKEAVLGTLNPEIEVPLKNLGAVRYHYIASDFADSKNIKAVADELNDRYTALRQIDGRCFIALSGEIGDASSEGTMLNSAQEVNCPHIVLVPRGKSVQAPCVWASAWCAKVSQKLSDDPASNTTDIETA